MNVRICAGLIGIVAILFSSACSSLGNDLHQSKQKRTVGQRVERFATSLTRTMTDVASDVLPIVSATTNEMVREVKSDLPKITEEVSRQLRQTSSSLLRPNEATR